MFELCRYRVANLTSCSEFRSESETVAKNRIEFQWGSKLQGTSSEALLFIVASRGGQPNQRAELKIGSVLKIFNALCILDKVLSNVSFSQWVDWFYLLFIGIDPRGMGGYISLQYLTKGGEMAYVIIPPMFWIVSNILTNLYKIYNLNQ